MIDLTSKKLVGVGLVVLIAAIISGFWLLKTPLKNHQDTLILNEKVSVGGGKTASLRSNGTIALKCIADFTQINYGKVEISPGTFLKAWTDCTIIDVIGQNKTITIPLFIENAQMSHATTTVGQVNKNGKTYEVSDAAIKKKIITSITKNSPKTDGVVVEVLGGGDTAGLLPLGNPYPDIYLKTGLDKNMLAFIESYDSQLLPKIGDINHVFFAYRVTILK